MSFDAFVDRVAERADTNLEQARDYVRAVLLTLRDAVGDDEYFDVTVQLPDDYLAALAQR
jgi:uncharacterized protein (DUF2267 family)